MRLRCYVDECGQLIGGTGINKPVLSEAREWAALAAYIVPEEQRQALRDLHGRVLREFSIESSAEVKAAHAGMYHEYSTGPHTNPNPQIKYLEPLGDDQVVALFTQLAHVFASIPGAVSIGVVGRVCDVYNPDWLQEKTRHNYIKKAGPNHTPPFRVVPERAYLMCYQTLLQRVEKHRREVGADEVQVVQDSHQYLEAGGRFREMHALLTQTGFSWGEDLQTGIDEVASTQLSHQHPGLQGADFVANAFRAWMRGNTPIWSRPLAGIVRKQGGRYAQRGLIGVPKGHHLQEEACQRTLGAVRAGEHPSPME